MIWTIICAYFLFRFLTNSYIDLKWKIIFTSIFLLARFMHLGIFSLIISTSVILVIVLMSIWNGDRIK